MVVSVSMEVVMRCVSVEFKGGTNVPMPRGFFISEGLTEYFSTENSSRVQVIHQKFSMRLAIFCGCVLAGWTFSNTAQESKMFRL